MKVTKNTYKILVLKSEGKRPLEVLKLDIIKILRDDKAITMTNSMICTSYQQY